MNSREFEIRVLAGMRRELSPARTGEQARLRSVTPGELLKAGRAGAQIVDVRTPADYAAAHLERSINIPLASSFESWAGAVLSSDEPAILVAPPGREQEAATRLEAAGIGSVAGYLKGGMQALEDRSPLLRGERRYSLPDLEEALHQPQPPQLIEIGRMESLGAGLKVPFEDLRKELEHLSPEREIAVVAETSFRTSAAASFLRSRGFPQVRTLAGGLAMWGRRPAIDRAPASRR